ncbi:S-adenosyl-L-methionine-dependent methyltransferase [Ampelomyces quisqualis]|uniref:S-adenosyl-L-methionine-dependent methyltransferase n=1 Tax=Ampelomyces quisqualis TaxID=50730 RepID=A0A6A5QNZ8_AMPQU|nr:S-adenosyl-L-methionine-dependent methyltransferase [Ampelomyces quisqualis]
MEGDLPPGEHAANIDIDTTYDDYSEDAEIEWDRESYASTGGGSLASNITRYRYENGRRYHAYRDGTYYAPNDEKNQSYETIVHHLWLLTLHDKLFLAPITNPKRILDVGTGTGLWAVDMADQFPNAEITATDLSPILYTSAPPNLTFEIDDACSEWTYPANHFDFIHIRGLTGCIRDWPYTYSQVHQHLAPGGWVEHLEFAIRTNADPHSARPADQILTAFSTSIINAGAEKTGMSFTIHGEMARLMRCAGFVDVHEEPFIWPIGAWPKDAHLKLLGRWGERNWSEGIEGWVMALYTRFLGWTYAEVQAFVADFRAVVRDRRNHFYHEVRCVYARKPFPHEVVGMEGVATGS